MTFSGKRPWLSTTSGDRQLHEAVMQSAEETVRMRFKGSDDRRTEGAADLTGMQGSAAQSWDSLSDNEDHEVAGIAISAQHARDAGGLSAWVARQPGPSALMAATGGALGMLVLRTLLRKLRRRLLAKRRL